METFTSLAGVYAAAITPMRSDFTPDLEAVPVYLDFLARRGCHGALLLGTTGEGPSFAPDERVAIFRAASQVRQVHPEFRLLAGTGTPSLTETVTITRAAFSLGMDGVVVLPPYYYRNASQDGLFNWFAEVLRQAVPDGGALFGYNIPPVTGVPLPLDLLSRLKDGYPNRFAGLKDSSGEDMFARQLGERFGRDLIILTGNDRLFSLALEMGAYGCITAMANVASPILRETYDAHQGGQDYGDIQQRLNAVRDVMEHYPPAPPLLKALLPGRYDLPTWTVRPPLMPLIPEFAQKAAVELEDVLGEGR